MSRHTKSDKDRVVLADVEHQTVRMPPFPEHEMIPHVGLARFAIREIAAGVVGFAFPILKLWGFASGKTVGEQERAG